MTTRNQEVQVESVIRLNRITVRNAGYTVVNDLDLRVPHGVIFSLVGPNGAGKSTTLDCVLGLRTPVGGEIRVAGLDPVRHRRAVHERLGVMLQENSLYKRIRVREAVSLFAAFAPSPRPVDEVLDAVQLMDRAKQTFGSLSGGQRRRLLLAIAIVGRPDILVLDEPTSGLDPGSANVAWSVLHAERVRGATILLSTHDMAEAQRECDLVAVIDRGRLVAHGTPGNLMSESGVETRLSAPLTPDGRGALDRVRGIDSVVFAEAVGGRVLVVGTGRGFVDAVTRELTSRGVPENQLELGPATFEDFYLVRTGTAYGTSEDT